MRPHRGLHAGLRAIDAPFALAVACDMPFLNPRVLRYMADLPRDYDALVPSIGGRWQPLHSIYAKAYLATVEDLLARAITDPASDTLLLERQDELNRAGGPGHGSPLPAGKYTTGPRPGSRR